MVNKKVLGKITKREIRTSLGRYFAILLIIAIGVGFFAGLRQTKPDMVRTGDQYLKDQNFQDFRFLSTLGYTDEEVDLFRNTDGITAAEGAYSEDFLADWGGSHIVVRSHSITDDIDKLVLTAGRMPETATEVFGDRRYFTEDDIGKTITLTGENSDEVKDFFNETTFTIVGIGNSPRYLNYERGTSTIGNGTVATFVYLLPEAYNSDYYTEILATADLPGSIYSDEYNTARDELETKLEDVAELAGDQREENIRADAEEQLSDARQELDDGWQEYENARTEANEKLNDAKTELEDARQTLDDGSQEVSDGETAIAEAEQTISSNETTINNNAAQLADKKSQLEAAAAQIASGEEQLSAAETELETKKTELQTQIDQVQTPLQQKADELTAAVAALQAQIAAAEAAGADETSIEALNAALAEAQAGLAQVDATLEQVNAAVTEAQTQIDAAETELTTQKTALAAQKKQVESGLAQISAGETSLKNARDQLQAAKTEVESKKVTLEDAKAELEQGETDYADGYQEYLDSCQEAWTKLQDARTELLEKEDEYAEAEQELADLPESENYVLDRDTNVGYVCFNNDTDIVEGISNIFPLFFFMVAAFVCITTMTRMVEEERTQIGTLKSLGYSNFHIVKGYLIYAGSAATVGWLLGYFAGTMSLPRIIWKIYAIMYGFAPMISDFSIVLFLVCLLASLLCSCGTVLIVSYGELHSTAATLLRPKTAKAGKKILLERITVLWKRLSFLHKVSVRNIFRYRSRMVMMLLGIGGCMALLMTGMGIRDSITNIVPVQYEEIQHDDISATLTKTCTPDILQKVKAIDGVENTVVAFAESDTVKANGNSKTCYVVAGDEDITEIFTLKHSNGKEVAYPEDGTVLICEGLAEELGVGIGDTVTISDSDNREVTVTIGDTYKNYVYYYLIMSPATYKEAYGEDPSMRTIYVQTDESKDSYEVAAEIGNLDNIGNVSVSNNFAERINKMLVSLNYVVLIVVVSAGALAFVVIYNLTNINITERIREIATLKVLGFYPKETHQYIFREILVLTAMGAIVGIPMGYALHAYVMDQIVVDLVTFPKYIAPLSILISFAMTMIFALLLSFILRRKIDKVVMVESLKSVD